VQLNRHALRAIRERSGLSRTALAQRAGISQPHLSNLELGRRQASEQVVVRLAAALAVPVPALVLGVDDDPAVSGCDPGTARRRPPPGWARAMSRGVASTGTEPDRMAMAVSASVTTNSAAALRPGLRGTGLP
jgi:DNA-binding XRE family transcriptional regulator